MLGESVVTQRRLSEPSTAAVSPGEVFPMNPEVGFSVSCSSLVVLAGSCTPTQSKPVFISLVSQAKCVMEIKKHLQDSCDFIKCLSIVHRERIVELPSVRILGCVVSFQLLPQISVCLAYIALFVINRYYFKSYIIYVHKISVRVAGRGVYF